MKFYVCVIYPLWTALFDILFLLYLHITYFCFPWTGAWLTSHHYCKLAEWVLFVKLQITSWSHSRNMEIINGIRIIGLGCSEKVKRVLCCKESFQISWTPFMLNIALSYLKSNCQITSSTKSRRTLHKIKNTFGQRKWQLWPQVMFAISDRFPKSWRHSDLSGSLFGSRPQQELRLMDNDFRKIRFSIQLPSRDYSIMLQFSSGI